MQNAAAMSFGRYERKEVKVKVTMKEEMKENMEEEASWSLIFRPSLRQALRPNLGAILYGYRRLSTSPLDILDLSSFIIVDLLANTPYSGQG